ncbi:efflux transporter periplasmic adaptor subunit [Gammaproteobacteria bacterium SCGC AG-212-F23]|nr:efflux transporter periplasmic adaptor subunit [Gammaproteobacteria bacterium SCGC AG-212-F23]
MYNPQWLKKKLQDAYKTCHDNGWFFWIITFFIIVLVVGLFHLFKSLNNHKPNVPVIIATAKTTNVPIYLAALGNVTPIYSVTIRTQINGQLLQVNFREGQIVKTGDLLALIDPRIYQAQYTQYQGQLARDTALLANAQIDLKRYQMLWRQNSVAKQILDTQTALVRQDEGTILLDQGLLQSAEVNLSYTRITSPIDGRVGLRLVDPGNFVQTSDTNGIAIVNMMNPITVVFTLPEDNIPSIQRAINKGKPLLVQAFDRQQNRLLATGTLLTMDNQVDPTTGTVKLKAIFKNENNMLFPNQFVNVALLVDVLANATIVPTEAIQHTLESTYVFVINEDHTVSSKPVTTDVTFGNNTVIRSGISPGQSVVTEGTDRLTAGSKITIVNNNRR